MKELQNGRGDPPESGRWARHGERHARGDVCNSLPTLDSPLSVPSGHSLGFWSIYRTNIFQGWAAAVHSIQSDLSQGKVHRRTGTVEATTDLVKTAATKSVYCDAVCSIPELFTRASAAHKEMFTHPGASPDAMCRALRRPRRPSWIRFEVPL